MKRREKEEATRRKEEEARRKQEEARVARLEAELETLRQEREVEKERRRLEEDTDHQRRIRQTTQEQVDEWEDDQIREPYSPRTLSAMKRNKNEKNGPYQYSLRAVLKVQNGSLALTTSLASCSTYFGGRSLLTYCDVSIAL